MRVARTRYPYLPDHAMVLPKRHAQSLEHLTSREFKEMTGLLSRILGSNEGLIAGANSGIVAGQTIPHLHVHLLRYPTREVEEHYDIHGLSGSATVMADPVGRQIIGRAAEMGLVPHAANSLAEYPSVRMRFDNWREFAGSQNAIARVVDSLRTAYTDLQERPPEGASPALVRAIHGQTRLTDRDGAPLQQGEFNWQWTLRLENGKPVFEIIPRTVGRYHGILEKAQDPEGGLLLVRNRKPPEPQWTKRQEEFYRSIQHQLRHWRPNPQFLPRRVLRAQATRSSGLNAPRARKPIR